MSNNRFTVRAPGRGFGQGSQGFAQEPQSYSQTSFIQNDDDDEDLAFLREQKNKRAKLQVQPNNQNINTDNHNLDGENTDQAYADFMASLEEDNDNNNNNHSNDNLSQNHNDKVNNDSNNDNDEVDPFEAFMAGVEKNEKEKEKDKDKINKNVTKPLILNEEADGVDLYLESKKKNNKLNNNNNNGISNNNNEEEYDFSKIDSDSDDDKPKANNLINEENEKVSNGLEALEPVDHSLISYRPFRKNFYKEHSTLLQMTPEENNELMKDFDINLKINNENNANETSRPRYCYDFKLLNMDSCYLEVLTDSLGYDTPTPVQALSIPILLSGYNLKAIATTGSGKTLGFALPLMIHLYDQPPLQRGDGPIGLILSPTRELTMQIHKVTSILAKPKKITSICVYGGANKHEQFRALKNGGEIVVATPGRLIDLISMGATSLNRVSFVVLDECDRMLEIGFEKAVRSILSNIRPDRQIALFTATMPPRMESLATELLSLNNSPFATIIVGTKGAAENIIQQVHVLKSVEEKVEWLKKNIRSFMDKGKVIIFVSTKNGCEELSRSLTNNKLETNQISSKNIVILHGDMTQHERYTSINRFKGEYGSILIATDVASRGLDVKNIMTVINFNAAKNITSHIHRIGRTGRAGEDGIAITLLMEKVESKMAAQLVNQLDQIGQSKAITNDLLTLANLDRKFKRKMNVNEPSSNFTQSKDYVRDSNNNNNSGNSDNAENLHAVPFSYNRVPPPLPKNNIIGDSKQNIFERLGIKLNIPLPNTVNSNSNNSNNTSQSQSFVHPSRAALMNTNDNNNNTNNTNPFPSPNPPIVSYLNKKGFSSSSNKNVNSLKMSFSSSFKAASTLNPNEGGHLISTIQTPSVNTNNNNNDNANNNVSVENKKESGRVSKWDKRG